MPNRKSIAGNIYDGKLIFTCTNSIIRVKKIEDSSRGTKNLHNLAVVIMERCLPHNYVKRKLGHPCSATFSILTTSYSHEAKLSMVITMKRETTFVLTRTKHSRKTRQLYTTYIATRCCRNLQTVVS
jgi:hypothetical protein